jgi:hypothetical protein
LDEEGKKISTVLFNFLSLVAYYTKTLVDIVVAIWEEKANQKNDEKSIENCEKIIY